MSKAFLSLRVHDPKKPDQAKNQGGHAAYIGTRPGVMMDAGQAHGLFGILMEESAEKMSIKDIADHVEGKVDYGVIAYTMIVSLHPDDAARLGCLQREPWKDWLARQMPTVADRLGIQVQNLEWVAAVHMKKTNPHCHVQFWDKEQTIKRPFVDKNVANAIRHDFTKTIYENDINALYAVKNEARAALTQVAGGFFRQFLLDFASLEEKEMEDAKKGLATDPDMAATGIIYPQFPKEALTELSQDWEKLKTQIPKSGRLAFRFLPPDAKQGLHNFVLKILEINTDCRREYQRYVHAATEIAAYYSSKEKLVDAAKNAEEEILNRLCNRILGFMKTAAAVPEAEWERSIPSQRQAGFWKQRQIIHLVTELFYFLSRQSNAKNAALNLMAAHGLSKQARKEYAIEKNSSTGFKWAEWEG
jgi:hypothetical protein